MHQTAQIPLTPIPDDGDVRSRVGFVLRTLLELKDETVVHEDLVSATVVLLGEFLLSRPQIHEFSRAQFDITQDSA